MSVLFRLKALCPWSCFMVKMLNIREDGSAEVSLFPSDFPGLDLLRTSMIF